MAQKIYVGMSGGVDSSVTAALLKQQGYDVTGVYMKNWSQDLPGMKCPWKDDYQDAKRVAVQLDIPFKMYDFEKEYRQKVVDYMVAEYQAGRTPNPDVMCNQEVKFKLFLDTALEDGADMIATGHYARTEGGQLLIAKNAEKDQTYFLYRVTSEALSKSLFPIGNFATKDEVRAIAKKLGLATAGKKDSQGICFVGKVGIKDFLLHELGPQPAGDIVDQKGKTIGRHDGAIFYTIGQRHGLEVGGGLPYYVVGKDMDKNEVYVTTDLQDERLWHRKLTLTDVHWIDGEPDFGKTLQVRTRYRAPLAAVEVVEKISDNRLNITLVDEIRALTPGQSAVFYDGETCLGGGIVI
ncbi:MAG TPA: tRNA 2-thiouridine(34) synthase MnmA [Candidatus Saccharimonadales bacterium]|nr:tRNA 2-thiouridine(34) synthase MnmA [Candidatus Saccharimonadales bacterium]